MPVNLLLCHVAAFDIEARSVLELCAPAISAVDDMLLHANPFCCL